VWDRVLIQGILVGLLTVIAVTLAAFLLVNLGVWA
jgi:hypothetical protein